MPREDFDRNEDYAEVVHRYKNTVYGIALSHVNCRSDADDIFQEVFMRYCQRRASFNSEEHRKAWLIKVTVLCCKKYRADLFRKRTVPIDEHGETAVFDSPELCELHSAILALDEKYRTVMYLHYIEDLPTKQIASMLGLRDTAVRMRLSRAREHLREKLKGEYFDD